MSVQFGRWNLDGKPTRSDYIEKVNSILAPFGPDSNESFSKDGISILYRAFCTTKESWLEKQPIISSSGAVITWDGRLDNRAELIGELRGPLSPDSTDVAIVAVAFEEWGVDCLGRLIGDYALAVWNPREHSVLLAKDAIGTKHLYYSFERDHITWSTILDPLVLYAGHPFAICEEYVAGWFATMFPAAHLTPYVGVHAVPPSCSVLLQPGNHGVKHIVRRHWDFNPSKRIRYRTDAEYEEHFRTVFANAVQRRLRSDRPVLAELSGGIDSSSIVCMADLIIARGQAECPRLDTLTWYDKSLLNWGEIPHFTRVEDKRGRAGHHIDAAALKEDHSPIPFGTEFLSDRFAPTPIPNSRTSELLRQSAAYMKSQGYRITLSGIGGEFTGDGVPTPTPEFQNLLARAHFFTLARQLKAWAAKMRKPRLPLLWQALRAFFPHMFQDLPEYINPEAPWFHRGFVRRNRAALRGDLFRVKLFGPSPSFQDNTRILDNERRLMAVWGLRSELLCEVRFPFLDRDFLEFTFAIPREQTVHVGQRRFLIKRALAGIVPGEILNRKKKEIAPQGPPENAAAETRTSAEWPSADEMGWNLASSSAGIVDSDRFWKALQKAQRNEEALPESLKRTLTLESWLRHLALQGAVVSPVHAEGQAHCASATVKDVRISA